MANTSKIHIGYLGHIYSAFIRVIFIMKRHSTNIVLLEPIMCHYSFHIYAGDWIRIQDFPQYILGAWGEPLRNMGIPLQNLGTN